MPDRPDHHRQRRVRIPAAIFGGLILALTLVLPALAAMGPTKLETASVDPRTGTTETTVSFQVTYRSVRGLGPEYVRVRVGATTFDMTGHGTDWRAGVVFTFATRLPIGTYDVLFQAKDAEKFVDELAAGSVAIAAPPPPPTPAPTPTHRPDGPAPTDPPDPGASPAPTPVPTDPSTGGVGPYVIRPHDTEFDPGYPAGTAGSAGGDSHGTSAATTRDAWWSEDASSEGGTDHDDTNGSGGATGAGPTTGGAGSGSGPAAGSGDSGTGDSGTGDPGAGRAGLPVGDPSDSVFSTPALAALAGHDPFGRPNAWLGAPLASALASLGIDAGRPTFVVGLVGSTAGVAVWMAFALFGKRRRDEQPPASEDILSAVARQGAPLAPVAAMVPPVDPELMMPRWRRPSLLEARKTDPTRTPAAARPRLTFGGQSLTSMSDGATGATCERRVIRYAVAPILDRPDELYGNRLGDLTTGDEVQLIERSGAFWMVLCPDGRQGWLHRMTLGDAVASRPAAFDVEPGDGQLDGQDALKALLAARGIS